MINWNENYWMPKPNEVKKGDNFLVLRDEYKFDNFNAEGEVGFVVGIWIKLPGYNGPDCSENYRVFDKQKSSRLNDIRFIKLMFGDYDRDFRIEDVRRV
jgi:hypothetical protein